MQIINIHKAKTEIISKKPKRRFGVLKGKIKIAKDFDAPICPIKIKKSHVN